MNINNIKEVNKLINKRNNLIYERGNVPQLFMRFVDLGTTVTEIICHNQTYKDMFYKNIQNTIDLEIESVEQQLKELGVTIPTDFVLQT